MVIKISKYHNWQSKVYKPKIDDYNCNSPEWLSIKLFIFTQQKCKCAMCKKELSIKYFTLHHIKSRAKGGQNNIDNLIGLCIKCHDIIEPQELSRNNIINYYNIKKVKKEKAPKSDWHMWVYGGFSRPGLKDKHQINKPIDIISDMMKKTKYEYPDNILLKEEYNFQPICPKCNSKNIYMAKLKKNELHCHKCNYIGKKEEFFYKRGDKNGRIKVD